MTDSELRSRLNDNLASVRSRIGDAASRARRSSADVTLVAISKYAGPKVAGMLHELGVADLGESRPQELWRKAAALPRTIRWHLVGHLQRNKIDRTLPVVSLIHSVDSLRLVDALADEATKQNRTVDLLLELNLSGEASKTGLDPELLPTVKARVAEWPQLRTLGLMTMAAHDDPEAARAVFRRLKHLGGPWLSMGMSDDFEIAIEEGATHVRVGSSLFDGIAAEVLRAD